MEANKYHCNLYQQIKTAYLCTSQICSSNVHAKSVSCVQCASMFTLQNHITWGQCISSIAMCVCVCVCDAQLVNMISQGRKVWQLPYLVCWFLTLRDELPFFGEYQRSPEVNCCAKPCNMIFQDKKLGKFSYSYRSIILGRRGLPIVYVKFKGHLRSLGGLIFTPAFHVPCDHTPFLHTYSLYTLIPSPFLVLPHFCLGIECVPSWLWAQGQGHINICAWTRDQFTSGNSHVPSITSRKLESPL